VEFVIIIIVIIIIIIIIILVSSANKAGLGLSDVILQRLLIYKRKNNGPSIDP
jgi:preprotein translocase subunit SecG